MFHALCLGVTLTIGQAPTEPIPLSPEPARNVAPRQVSPPGRAVISVEPGVPSRLPAFNAADPAQPKADPAKKDGNGEAKKDDEEKKDEEEKKEPEKGHFMKLMEGTSLGCWMEQKKITVSGWTQMSYTASQAHVTSAPMVWNDRANRFLLQQEWLRIEKAIDTESKEASYGWHIDALFGTDYRFMLMRGLFNQQLLNSKPNPGEIGGFEQNLYGFDLPQFYVNAYLPNLFEGTEVRIGRMYTPWGLESVEGPTSPLLSRSYAFNWSPPFFHMAIAVLPKFNKNWSGQFMLANGNDVFFDPAEEIRFVGALTWKSDDEKDSVTFATSMGRGKFNAGDPFNPATNGLQSEAAGRNNMNAFDIVWNHKFCDKFNYGVEMIYGYQTGVPSTASVGVISGALVSTSPLSGTAHWGSIAQYFTYNWTDKLSSILRAEVFDDFEGQRTGYEGLYTGVTLGAQYKPKDWLWLRPEIRYDYNGYSQPFDNGRRHGLLTASTDLIIKW